MDRNMLIVLLVLALVVFALVSEAMKAFDKAEKELQNAPEEKPKEPEGEE